jgi:glucokinase
MAFIGIDFGATRIKAGLVVDDKIIKYSEISTDNKYPSKNIINNLIKLINKLITKEVKGIAIGVPGIVDIDKGIIVELTNVFSFKKIPLKKVIEKEFKIPVMINNDSNCFALGEKYFGKGKKHNTFAIIIIGTGLGSGLIINNKLYAGKDGYAGEINAIPYLDGNFEDYTSSHFFERNNVSGEELFKRAKNKDKFALNLFSEFGIHLGKAVCSLITIIDPEIIIFGGSISKSHKFFEKSMKKTIKEYINKDIYKKLKIEFTDFTQEKAILGAGKLFEID